MLVHAFQEKMDSTNLLTSYTSGGIEDGGDQGIEEYMVAGVVVLGVTRSRDKLSRTLLVLQLRPRLVFSASGGLPVANTQGFVTSIATVSPCVPGPRPTLDA